MSSRTSWVERCIAVEAVMLLAALVTPALRESSHHQVAQRAARAIRIVCAAAATAHARTGEWPQDGVSGRAPEAMKPYLPAGFTFQTSGYQLDWDHWTLSDGPESFSPTSQFQGVSVSTRDPRTLRSSLCRRASAMIPPPFARHPRDRSRSEPIRLRIAR